MKNNVEKIIALHEKVKGKKPLIHHITNYVTVNDCANVTLAIGGSPVMADDLEEVEEIASIAQGLVINIGTLNRRTIDAMALAGKKANEMEIPVIFDPVGAGASILRNKTVERLLQDVQFTVIRGNISEIRYVASSNAAARGVDAAEADMKTDLREDIRMAENLARRMGSTIVITGKVDIITDGVTTCCVENGHPAMGNVSGTGCMCGSLIASFCAVSKDDTVLGALSGIVAMGIAGELAYEATKDIGNGTFHYKIIDEVSRLNDACLKGRTKFYETSN